MSDRDMTVEMWALVEQAAAHMGPNGGYDFRHGTDWYDAWGATLGWMFAINDRITELGGTTNPTFRQAMGGPDTEAYEYEMLVEFDVGLDDLEAAERLLDQLADMLRAAGRDY